MGPPHRALHHPSLWQGNQHLTGLRLSNYLEIQVTSTEDKRATPPPPHAWQAPIVEGMVLDGKADLTEAIVTGPGWAILFYRQWLLGEGLSLGEVWDAVFTLSGAISLGWQTSPTQCTKPISLHNGW